MRTEKMPHIGLSGEDAAEYAILPGDPGRVERVAAYLTQVEDLGMHREYRSMRGVYQDKKILVMSTGMGGPSTAIAVEELADLGVRYMIRIGSCGVMTEGIAVGDLILSQASCKNEGTSRTYQPIEIPAVPDYGLLKRCEESATELGFPCHVGLTRSHDGIYAKEKKAIDAAYAPQGVLASDMETTALYVVGRLRGVKTVSILNVVARCAGDIFADIAEYGEQESMADLGEMREIKTALHVLAGLM